MTYVVGDTVYANFGRYGRAEAYKGKVIRVTPTGQIAVQFEKVNWKGDPIVERFKNGWAIGHNGYYRPRLIDRETYERLGAQTVVRDALLAFNRAHDNFVKTRADAIELAAKLTKLAQGIPDDA